MINYDLIYLRTQQRLQDLEVDFAKPIFKDKQWFILKLIHDNTCLLKTISPYVIKN
jgi:hypothetical protein